MPHSTYEHGLIRVRPSIRQNLSRPKQVKDHVLADAANATTCFFGNSSPPFRPYPALSGHCWANYHRHVCSAKAFWNADRTVHYQLLRWAKRTHPNKSYGWLKQKYFSYQGQFGFFARQRTSTGEIKVQRLHSPRRTVIERHVKVRGEANPYDPVYTEYFERRRSFIWRTLPLQKDWSPRPRRAIKGSGCSR